MSGEDSAHIAECSDNTTPMNNEFDGRLCCEVREVCTDGIDNDGDGFIDCADSECNQASGATDPFSSSQPQICRVNSCPATLHVGLQGFWQFENNTADNSGNGYTAVTIDTPVFEKELGFPAGAALRFDGEDRIRISEQGQYDVVPGLDTEDQVTVTAWVNADNVAPGATDYEAIVNKGNSAGDSYVLNKYNGTYGFYVQDQSGSQQRISFPATQGEWTHIAGTYNPSDTPSQKFYVNGAEVNTSNALSGLIREDDSALTIGDRGPSSPAGFTFEGIIDQVRVYNRTLTASEVASFVDPECRNRQRTIECIQSPELCESPSDETTNRFHCNYGEYDDPQRQGTGVCCPQDQDAQYDSFTGQWSCAESNQCGISSGSDCEYNISASTEAYFNSTSDGTSNACTSQVPSLNVDLSEQPAPEKRSQACCYVPKQGELNYWYKDGNVEIYG